MTALQPVTHELLLATSDCLAMWRHVIATTPYNSDERWYVFEDLDDLTAEIDDVALEMYDHDGLTPDVALLNTAQLLIVEAYSRKE